MDDYGIQRSEPLRKKFLEEAKMSRKRAEKEQNEEAEIGVSQRNGFNDQ